MPVLALGAGAGAVKGCTVCAHTFVRTLYTVLCATSGSQPTIVSACFSLLHTKESCWILLGLGRVKPTGFAFCARSFVRINLYGQDHTALSFYRSLLQACYKGNSGAGYWILLGLGPMTLTGFAVCAHTCVRINLYAQEHTRDSYGVLTANLIRMSWLRALSKGCQCWCWCGGPGCWWLSARLRRAAVLVGCWCRPRVSWQSARARAVEAP